MTRPGRRRASLGIGVFCLVFAALGDLAARAYDPATRLGVSNPSRVRMGTTHPVSPRAGARLDWKAVLVGGHHIIDSYNNAATDLAGHLRRNGVRRVAVLHSRGPQAGSAMPVARQRELRRTLSTLGPSDACLFFITSHASERGIYLSADNDYLDPRELSALIDLECGNRPSVLILSGCGTGSFITPSMTADNRIILAASARGRVSYGAAMSDRHVNFDRCMLQAMDEGVHTWRQVFDRILPCVAQRERALGVTPSHPQGWFGRRIRDLALPGRGWYGAQRTQAE